MTDKKVLIVSFYFPPSTNIGGRRWSKFSKYLIKKGVDVHIVSSYSQLSEGENEKDIGGFKNKITYLKFNFPEVLLWMISSSYFDNISKKI